MTRARPRSLPICLANHPNRWPPLRSIVWQSKTCEWRRQLLTCLKEGFSKKEESMKPNMTLNPFIINIIFPPRTFNATTPAPIKPPPGFSAPSRPFSARELYTPKPWCASEASYVPERSLSIGFNSVLPQPRMPPYFVSTIHKCWVLNISWQRIFLTDSYKSITRIDLGRSFSERLMEQTARIFWFCQIHWSAEFQHRFLLFWFFFHFAIGQKIFFQVTCQNISICFTNV